MNPNSLKKHTDVYERNYLSLEKVKINDNLVGEYFQSTNVFSNKKIQPTTVKKIKFDFTNSDINDISKTNMETFDTFENNRTYFENRSYFFNISKKELCNNMDNFCSLKNCANKFKMNKMQKFIIELSDEIDSLKFINSSLLKSLKIKEEYIFNILRHNNLGLNNFNPNKTTNFKNFKPVKSEKFKNNFSLSSADENNNYFYSNKNLNSSEFNYEKQQNLNNSYFNTNINNNYNNTNQTKNLNSNEKLSCNINSYKESNNTMKSNITNSEFKNNVTENTKKSYLSKNRSTKRNLPIIEEKYLKEKMQSNQNIIKVNNDIDSVKTSTHITGFQNENMESSSFNKTGFIYKLVNKAIKDKSEKIEEFLKNKNENSKKDEDEIKTKEYEMEAKFSKKEIENESKFEEQNYFSENNSSVQNHSKDNIKNLNKDESKNKKILNLNIEIPNKKNSNDFSEATNKDNSPIKTRKKLRFSTSLTFKRSKEVLNEINPPKNIVDIDVINENRDCNEENLKEKQNINKECENKEKSSIEQILFEESPNKYEKRKLFTTRANTYKFDKFKVNNFRSAFASSPKKSYNNLANLNSNSNINNVMNQFQLQKNNNSGSFNLNPLNKNNLENINSQKYLNLQKQISANSNILNFEGVRYVKINSHLHNLIVSNGINSSNNNNNSINSSKFLSNQNSHYNKILGLFNRIQKSSKTSNNRISFLSYSDSVLDRMVKSDLINEIGKLTNSDEEFLVCMRAFKDDNLLLFCDLISTLVKDYQYSVQLIRKIKTFLLSSVKLVNSINVTDALKIIISNCNEVIYCEKTVIYQYDKHLKKLVKNIGESERFSTNKNGDPNKINEDKVKFYKEDEELKINPGEGVVGWVFEHNQKQKIDDMQKDNRFSHHDNDKGKRSGGEIITILCTPLRDEEGNAYGVLECSNKKSGFFTNDDEELMDIFAKQISSILTNILQYDEYNTHISRLQWLLDFSLKTPPLGEFKAFIGFCENAITRLWGVHFAKLFFIDKSDTNGEFIKYINGTERISFKPIGIVGKCFLKRGVIPVTNIYESQDYNSLIDIEGCFCLVTFPIFDCELSKNIYFIMQVEFNSNLLHLGRLKKNHLEIFYKFSTQVSFWFSKIIKE